MSKNFPKNGFLSFGALLGATLLLSACGGGGGGGGTATPRGDQLVIQPIQVCDDGGGNCAQIGFFEAITNKIWSQAGINVTFLPPNQLNNSIFLSIAPGSGAGSEFSQLAFSGPPGAFGRHPSSARNSGPLNLWFVDTIEASGGLVQFGSGWVGANGVLISDDIFSFNGGIGRLDVIAHEIGHNLGLRHSGLGAGAANNLMSDGQRRAIPSSIDDIFPSGAGLDQLTSEQVQVALGSGLLMNAAGAAVLGTAPDEMAIAAADAVYGMGYVVEPSQLLPQADDDRGGAKAVDSEMVQVPEPGISVSLWCGVVLGILWFNRRRA